MMKKIKIDFDNKQMDLLNKIGFPYDIILLEHEYAEQALMKQGLGQYEAHVKASEKYDYGKALKERK